MIASQLTVFPNPSNGTFEQQLSDLKKGEATVYDTRLLYFGCTIWHKTLGDVRDWSENIELKEGGVYVLTIEMNQSHRSVLLLLNKGS